MEKRSHHKKKCTHRKPQWTKKQQMWTAWMKSTVVYWIVLHKVGTGIDNLLNCLMGQRGRIIFRWSYITSGEVPSLLGDVMWIQTALPSKIASLPQLWIPTHTINDIVEVKGDRVKSRIMHFSSTEYCHVAYQKKRLD